MARSPQLQLLKKAKLSYGGELLKTREGRSGPRPLDTRNSMHLVLRSSKAKGDWSFRRPQQAHKIRKLIEKFSRKYGVRVFSFANVGNHLHLHIKLGNRHAYKPFIRALTSAIAMAVTGISRWSPRKADSKLRFWDYRPFTRVVQGFKSLLTLRDYIYLNKLEGYGVDRRQTHFFLKLKRGAQEEGAALLAQFG